MLLDLICYCNKCRVTDSRQEFTACYFCDRTYRLKCVGLTTKVKNYLEKNIGLRWRCKTCRDIEVQVPNIWSEPEKVLRTYRSFFIKQMSFSRIWRTCSVIRHLNEQPKRKNSSSASRHAQPSFSIPQSDLNLQQSNKNSIS